MSTYRPHTVASAPSASKPTLESVQRALGFLPNLFATMAESPVTLNGYVALDGVLGQGTLSRADRQVLLTAISSENGCAYCTAAHSTLAGMFKADAAAIAEARGDVDPAGSKLHALTKFTRDVIRNRGQLDHGDLGAFLDAGYTKGQALEVVANIGLKTISNFIVGFADVPLDEQFEAQRWESSTPVTASRAP
jgi:uncharacterized peroxidase-related enzyme